jgi:hypothetical protein
MKLKLRSFLPLILLLASSSLVPMGRAKSQASTDSKVATSAPCLEVVPDEIY